MLLFLGCLSLSLLCGSSALNLWIWSHHPSPQVALSCLIPFTLACWAVPLGCLYRLTCERKIPAGLPHHQRGSQISLQSNYRSPFWQGYRRLFAASLMMLPLHLLFAGSAFLWLYHLTLLVLAVQATWETNLSNRQQVALLDPHQQRFYFPTLGWIPREDLSFSVQPQVEVTPRRDLQRWWVVVAGRRWKALDLEEKAWELADWLRVKTSGR